PAFVASPMNFSSPQFSRVQLYTKPRSQGHKTVSGRTRLKSLLNHLVGAGEERLRHGQAEGFCGFQVDDEFEFGRLLHWQIGGLRALEDPPGVDPGLTANRWPVNAEADQAAQIGER